jgi:hypothetical protein
MGWRLLPRLMARTLQATTLTAADAYRITLLSGVIVDTLCGTLSGYRIDASGYPVYPDPPLEGVGRSGLTISGIVNLAYPLDRVAAALNIVSTDQLLA